LKILSLSTLPLLPHLGSGKTRIRWTEGLRELGHEVEVLQPADFELWPNQIRAKKYRQAVGVFLKVRQLLKIKEYDLIEFYGDEYWLLLLWLTRKKKRPLLVAHVDGIELHDMDKEQRFWHPRVGFKKWLFTNTHYRFSKITFSLADRYVCGCQDDLEYVVQQRLFSREHAECISPALDELFHEIPFQQSKEKIILFLGSWIDRKGIRIIPEVLSKILYKYPDYQFHVYGAWYAKDYIEQLFANDLTDRIRVFYKLPQVELLEGIKKSAIFFFPSYSEGFGLATAEAMSCGCAVVTTKTGLGSNLETDKEALICEFDNVEQMEEAIAKLILNEELRSKIALSGYNKVRGFIWQNQIQKLEKTYSNWLNSCK